MSTLTFLIKGRLTSHLLPNTLLVGKMSSAVLRRVDLVGTDVSENIRL
jgi:hypothetical protein